MKEIRLPNEVRFILDKLNESGYRAYIVGGCVRDSIMGKEPKDWDICTSATPDQIKAVFDGYRTIDTGIKHGTVTVVLSNDQYEITTFRVDGNYSDARHPDSVRFVSDIIEDLARRDFTMNAIAYHPKEGFIDPFGGCGDIEIGYIRCVGSPEERFSEDPLRILRAMRFSSVYGLEMADSVWKNAKNMSHLLSSVSKERISSELTKILCGYNCTKVMRIFPCVMLKIIPAMLLCIDFDQKNPHHKYNLYEHLIRSVGYYDGDDHVVKLALLLHDIAKPITKTEDSFGIAHYHSHGRLGCEFAESILKDLRYDNQTIKSVKELIFYHDAEITETARSVKRWIGKIGEKQFDRLLSVKMADAYAKSTKNQDDKHIKNLTAIFEKVLLEDSCFTLKDMNIDGNDIIRLGVPQGEAVGEILENLLNLIIDGFIENEREVLLKGAAVLAEDYTCKK